MSRQLPTADVFALGCSQSISTQHSAAEVRVDGKAAFIAFSDRQELELQMSTAMAVLAAIWLLSKIRLLHFRVRAQLFGITLCHDLSLHQHVAEMRDGQRLVDVLLDEQYGDAEFIDALDNIERLLHKSGRQSQ